MKPKKVTVESIATIAFDNHQITVKGEGLNAVLQLTNQSEFNSLKAGDVLTIAVAGKKAKE